LDAASAGPARATLGVLPYGTGGDFRRGLGLPRRLAEASEWLTGGATTAIDVGRVTFATPEGGKQTRHFVNIASFGISGLVDSYVNQSSKRLGVSVYHRLNHSAVVISHSFLPCKPLDDRDRGKLQGIRRRGWTARSGALPVPCCDQLMHCDITR